MRYGRGAPFGRDAALCGRYSVRREERGVNGWGGVEHTEIFPGQIEVILEF